MPWWRFSFAVLLLASLTACDRGSAAADSDKAQSSAGTGDEKPNILFVVWDTVRGDRMSLLGYERKTTPYLDEFAKSARVYENCVAVSGTTVPSHLSMFTGLLPDEHGSHNEKPRVPDNLTLLSEILKTAGYQSYAYSANPQISANNNFNQGIDLIEHPWSEAYIRKAGNLTLSKMDAVGREQMLAKMRSKKRLSPMAFTATGPLAQEAVNNWLDRQDAERPVYIFLNYMEAHRPLLPRREFRAAFIPPEQIAASYRVQPTWSAMWAYVFGLREISPADMELISAVYDAALLELDHMFHELLASLRARGRLENTIVLLVSDHGEHLGEHHLLDHQFSVYEQLLRVPLVLHYPPRIKPGRDTRPVISSDLFPTLLELAGLDCPSLSKSISLLHTPAERPRLGACPSFMPATFYAAQQEYPRFDARPWQRTLRAYYEEPYKYIEASDGRHELYDLVADPAETNNLFTTHPSVVRRLAASTKAYVDSLRRVDVAHPEQRIPPEDEEHRRRLAALGYAGAIDEPNEPAGEEAPASRPSSAPATRQPVRP